MPRDANGNYTLPAGNPVATGTLITSTWANDTMSDVGNELTDSLSRSGKGGLTGPLPIIDKSGSVPGLSFSAEPTSGFKREGSGDVRIQVQGSDRLQCQGVGPVRVDNGTGFQPVATEPTDRKVMYGEGGITVAYFYTATAPPGWTIEEPDTNLRNLVVGPAAGGGIIGGTQDPVDLAINADLSTGTTALDGSHTHTGNTQVAAATRTVDEQAGGVEVSRDTHGHNLLVDVGGDHQHALTGNATETLTPYYARGILAKLDA